MNAVQAHLDDFTSWDRRVDRSLAARVHEDVKACQVARISPRYIEAPRHIFQLKTQADYIKHDLQPAIKMLVFHEKMGLDRLTKLRATNANFTVNTNESDQSNGTKRNREEDLEIQQAAKKRKQDTDKKLDSVVDELQCLRRLVDGKMETTDIETRQGFHKLEGKILELMAAGI